jgi:CheY-like chemotaxis protein
MSKVLIVDDNADAAQAMAGVLRKRGHEATCAHTGRAAMALLIGDTPDFAVFDYKMPGMSGIELLHAMRSYLRLQHLPVMFITAYPEAPELANVRELDVLGVLPKVNLDLCAVADLVDLHARLNPPPSPEVGN